jgi:hypothetical protein
VRDNGYQALGHRYNVMIEPLQSEAMEVNEIARKLELYELALPALQVLGPSHPTVKQKRRFIELAPSLDEGPMCGNFDAMRDQFENDLLFLGTDIAPGREAFGDAFQSKAAPQGNDQP